MNAALAAAATSDALQLFDVTLVGVTERNAWKVVFTIAFVIAVLGLRNVVRMVMRRVLGGEVIDTRRFWARQGLQVITAIVLTLGILSIWITPGTDLTVGFGLISAGLAFALRQVILSLAAYFVILRGDTFAVGDRITLGGVRGDVVRLGFLKTTIMEMGQPPVPGSDAPAVWVTARQYTGRIVTVTNSVIFSEPVYNFSGDFPYLWEEITITIPFTADRARAEQILLAAAREHAVVDDPAAERALAHMRSRYAMSDASLTPAVYVSIGDNGVKLALRFLVAVRGVRGVKDQINRQILDELDAAGIGVASTMLDIVGLPPVVTRGASSPS